MQKFPNRKRIRLEQEAYKQGCTFFTTITTFQRYPWFHLLPELAGKATELLPEMVKERSAALFSWCIMPDHIHFLLQDKDIIDFVRLLKGRLTPEARRLQPGKALWQRSFYEHALRKEEVLSDVSLYIWENPVRAGLVVRASAYPWSGSLVWPDWREWAETNKTLSPPG